MRKKEKQKCSVLEDTDLLFLDVQRSMLKIMTHKMFPCLLGTRERHDNQ